ncbi:MAG: methyltransferase domain-containing protein [Oceanospirillaceae bacterium]|nr:methyltransferase domain-containing protein [Oceanospirillaceae bacterium]MCP5351214.1 methyltransferase domain-containing protein [Oceanospirillaceae bacterium]
MPDEVLLLEEHDAHGVMRVIEIGAYRFLEFGGEVEQSCVYMPDPSWLEYDYTRCMLMFALAHPQPESALFLGLGAGSLSNACLRFLPLKQASAIELREALPRIARQLLGLSQDPRLSIVCGDAADLLPAQARVDLLFVDLYTDHGPSEVQQTADFLRRCQRQLNPGGLLIINQWSADNGQLLAFNTLREVFADGFCYCPLEERNQVVLVGNGVMPDTTLLKNRITALAPELGYSLQPLLDLLRCPALVPHTAHKR